MNHMVIRSPPTPVISLVARRVRPLCEASPSQNHCMGTRHLVSRRVPRRSTTPAPAAARNIEEGVNARVRRRLSLSPLSNSPSLASPTTPHQDITPVAPLLGIIPNLPPISPDTPNFPVFSNPIQDDPDDDANLQQQAWFEYLSPSHGISHSPTFPVSVLQEAPESPDTNAPNLGPTWLYSC